MYNTIITRKKHEQQTKELFWEQKERRTKEN